MNAKFYNNNIELADNQLDNLSPDPEGEFCPVDVPGDGNCLFWSGALAYLISSYAACPTRENFIVVLQKFFKDPPNYLVNSLEGPVKKYLENSESDALFGWRFEILMEKTRALTAEYMYENPGLFESYVEGDYAEYIKKLKKSGTWGGQTEIAALCNLLGCKIHVRYVTDGREVLHQPIIKPIDDARCLEDMTTLNLLYDSRNRNFEHYTFLVKSNFLRKDRMNLSVCPFSTKFEDDLHTKKKPKSTSKIMDITAYLNSEVYNAIVKGGLIGACIEVVLWLLPFDDYYLKKILNANKPMLVGACLGASVNLARHFGLMTFGTAAVHSFICSSSNLIDKKSKSLFFNKTNTKIKIINQEVSRLDREVSPEQFQL